MGGKRIVQVMEMCSLLYIILFCKAVTFAITMPDECNFKKNQYSSMKKKNTWHILCIYITQSNSSAFENVTCRVTANTLEVYDVISTWKHTLIPTCSPISWRKIEHKAALKSDDSHKLWVCWCISIDMEGICLSTVELNDSF